MVLFFVTYLCVGNTCVTEVELQTLLQIANVQINIPTQQVPPLNSATSSTVVTTEPISDSIPTQTIEPLVVSEDIPASVDDVGTEN